MDVVKLDLYTYSVSESYSRQTSSLVRRQNMGGFQIKIYLDFTTLKQKHSFITVLALSNVFINKIYNNFEFENKEVVRDRNEGIVSLNQLEIAM